MENAKRPWGVSLLAILFFVGVASYTMLTLLTIAAPETLRSVLIGLSPQGSGPELLLSMGGLLTIYFTIMAIVAGLIGYGLWTLRNWARWLVIVITALSLLAAIAGIVQALNNINPSTLLLGFFRIGLSTLVLWYLWAANVRVAFGRRIRSA